MKIKVIGETKTRVREKLLQLDIAFVIDTTGSMGGEISQVQSRLRELVQSIISHPLRPKARFSVVGYRDHPPQDATYVSTVFSDLDSDLKKVQHALVSVKAGGGGDGPEAVADGIYDALGLSWEKLAQKSILLVGDAPPHGEDGAGDGFSRGCPCGLSLRQLGKQMSAIGLTGHAIGVRNDPTMIRTFSEFAKLSGGIFVNLSRLSDLIPLLMTRIGEEMEKIARDIRTLEKIEAGRTLSAEDRESVESLAKKGVRIIPPAGGREPDRETSKKLHIRVVD